MFPTTKVTCGLGTLAAGDSVSRTLGVSWSEAGNQTVTATVNAHEPRRPRRCQQLRDGDDDGLRLVRPEHGRTCELAGP